jgi:hypothetical protein
MTYSHDEVERWYLGIPFERKAQKLRIVPPSRASSPDYPLFAPAAAQEPEVPLSTLGKVLPAGMAR